jgi:hypothetical protein
MTCSVTKGPTVAFGQLRRWKHTSGKDRLRLWRQRLGMENFWCLLRLWPWAQWVHTRLVHELLLLLVEWLSVSWAVIVIVRCRNQGHLTSPARMELVIQLLILVVWKLLLLVDELILAGMLRQGEVRRRLIAIRRQDL